MYLFAMPSRSLLTCTALLMSCHFCIISHARRADIEAVEMDVDALSNEVEETDNETTNEVVIEPPVAADSTARIIQSSVSPIGDLGLLKHVSTKMKRSSRGPPEEVATGWLSRCLSLMTGNGTSVDTGDGVRITHMSTPSGRVMLERFHRRLSEELLSPFKKKKMSTSKSGAVFYRSLHGEFILKRMPSEGEFGVLGKLETPMAKHFEDAQNNVLRTSINPVLLSFATEGASKSRGLWALMVVESVSMIEAASDSDDEPKLFNLKVVKGESDENLWATNESVETIHMPKNFDVKPLPIGSKERQPFFRYLEGLTHGHGVGSRWWNIDKLHRTMNNDLSFLTAHNFIDYSIFFMFQKVEVERFGTMPWDEVFKAMQDSLPRCIWFAKDPASPAADKLTVYFMCVAVIDYLMDYTTLTLDKRAENRVLFHKWDRWGAKMQELVVCVTNPCVEATERTSADGRRILVYDMPDVGYLQYVNGCHKYRALFHYVENKNCSHSGVVAFGRDANDETSTTNPLHSS